MPKELHIVHVQQPTPRFLRSRYVLGVIIGTGSGVLAGWWLVA